MNTLWKLQVLILTTVFGVVCEGRVFRLGSESVAAYFGGSYAPSHLLQTQFSGTSGTGITVDKSVKTDYGGEFGMLVTSASAGLRFGVELIKPGTLKEAVGSDNSAQAMYGLESNISALVPKLTIELNLKTTDHWRVFLAVGGGTATTTYKNSYVFTTAGQAAFPGVADYSEEATGTGLMYDGGIAFEGLMNDTTTISILAGYRQLKISQYKYKADVTTLTGSHLKNDIVLNDDGTNKQSLFTGAMASVLFRFYVGK